jgi:hypothetical protein
MADANLIQVASLQEVTWGTTPASTLQIVPITGGSMSQGLETTRSNTIRSDAQLANTTRTSITPSASYDFEFSAKNQDPWLKGAVRSDADWSTAVTFTGTVTTVQAAKTYAATSIEANITKGQWVFFAGLANAASNGWQKVVTVAAGILTVQGPIGANETSVAGVTMKTAQITNGSTAYSFSLQQYFTDLTSASQYHQMVGARPNSFRLSLSQGGILTGSCAFDGKSMAQGNATLGSGPASAAFDKDPAADVDVWGGLYIDGVAYTGDLLEWQLNIAQSTRPRRTLGSTTRTGIAAGAVGITGSLRMYLDDTSKLQLTKELAFTSVALGFSLVLGSDRYFIELPLCKYTAEPGSIGGLDQDVELNLEFAAEPGGSFGASSLEKTITISRVVT